MTFSVVMRPDASVNDLLDAVVTSNQSPNLVASGLKVRLVVTSPRCLLRVLCYVQMLRPRPVSMQNGLASIKLENLVIEDALEESVVWKILPSKSMSEDEMLYFPVIGEPPPLQ